MRKKYRSLTRRLKEELLQSISEENNSSINQLQANIIITVEMMLLGFNLATGSKDAKEVWAVIPGYDVFNIPGIKEQAIIGRLRILFGFYRAEARWQKDLELYSQISPDYRLFSLSDTQEFIENTVRYVPHRKEFYLSLLENPIQHRQKDQAFSSPGDFYYERFEGQDKILYQGKLPDFPISRSFFPLYREKRKETCNINRDWEELERELTQLAPQEKWSERLKALEILPLSRNQVISYMGINHIVGGLGTGKSTFRVVEAYRLVSKCQARVGMIEGSVAEVNKRVHELQQLGLKAVPIIGLSNRNKHMETYLATVSGKIGELSDWVEEKYSPLKHLSGECFVHALCGEEKKDYLPCEELHQGRRTVRCSLAHICGVYENFRQLIEADVWVTTTAAVLNTSLPSMFDSYQRRVFEAMYDLLDVIFIDEADMVQEQFDSTFIEEYDLIGSPNHNFEELDREVLAKVSGRYSSWAGNPLINNYRTHLQMMDQIVWKIYQLLDKSPRLRSHLRYRKVFHIYALASELSGKLSIDPSESSKIWKKLIAYISNPVDKGDLSQTAERLLELDAITDSSEFIKDCISGLTKQTAPRIDLQLLELQLEFFFYLGHFEHELKYILENLEIIHDELDISTPLGKIFGMRREFAPFLKGSMTGMLVGYRYLYREEGLGVFKFFEYSGVGRLLLHEWAHVYRTVDEQEGPGVVLLSGTSHAPGSRHHDVQIPVQWLLKSINPSGQLEQFFHPVFDPQTGEEIFISGVSDSYVRRLQLEKEVELIKPLIQNELEYWENEGRRVLLVVNSYEDLKSVARVLKRDSDWQKRFKVLSRDMDDDELDYSFPVASIAQFREESAEILVTPLLSMNRGHNVLDDEGGALFGSVFFLIRPYPVPDDLSYIIKALHAQLPDFLADIDKKKLFGAAAIKELRKVSIRRLEMMVRKPDFWSILKTNDRKALSWFILIPVWQMIGRLIRGNRDARVFYIDAKFGMETMNGPEKIPSLLNYWREMFEKAKHDKVVQALYGPFSSTLPKL